MAVEERAGSSARAQNVILENRKNLHVSGVEDVSSFDETMVVMQTQLGELEVRGEQLHVSELSVGTGDLLIEGYISGVNYAEKAVKTGLWEKLFG